MTETEPQPEPQPQPESQPEAEVAVRPNVEFGALIGKGVLLIILGVLIMILINSSIFGAITASTIPAVLLAILLIFFGISLLCGGTSFGKSGVASVVLGILVIILGIIALCNPVMFSAFLVYFVAAAALVGGIFNLVTGIMGAGNANRVLTIIIGILGILVGIAIFAMAFHITPFLTAPILVYIMAIFLLIYGVISIIQAIILKSQQKKAEIA